MRHRIYRELLLKPNLDDSQGEAEVDYFDEHQRLADRILYLEIEYLEDSHEIYLEIMRTNKKIHEEAAGVLYGENWFTWSVYGYEYQPISHCPRGETALCPRRYSRLITKLHLKVSTSGDGNDFDEADAISWTTKNLKHACKVLSLNNLKTLMVDFYNSIGRRHGGSTCKGWYGERCLEPLKDCRAEKVSIDYVNKCTAGLKLTGIIVLCPPMCFSSLCCRVESHDRRSQGCGLSSLSQSNGGGSGKSIR